METKDVIKELNGLIQINNDRIEGYQTAADEAKDADLKSLFARFADKSRGYKNELTNLVRTNGGEPAEGTTTSGKVYRAWMDVKAALASDNRKAVLSNCEFGEDAALEAYRSVTESKEMTIPANVRDILSRQLGELKSAHDEIKSLRDSN